MKVILAGYNIDSAVIEELKGNSPPRDDITPETLSASYARVSRDPRPIDELRAVARAEVERARKSNRNILFRMGHHSVAEHAVFNFDIIGVSRLALEEIEKFRLCSYTEKSQRYVTLRDDFIVPEEIKRAGLMKIFDAKTYEELEERAKMLGGPKNEAEDKVVQLVAFTPDADDRLIEALLHTSTSHPYTTCFKKAKRLSSEEKIDFLKLAFNTWNFMILHSASLNMST